MQFTCFMAIIKIVNMYKVNQFYLLVSFVKEEQSTENMCIQESNEQGSPPPL